MMGRPVNNCAKVGKDTGNQYELVEQWGRQGFGPPLHLHKREAEGFYVLEGEVTFAVGDQTVKASAGSFVHVPAKIKHAFRVDSPTARFLTCITPAGLAGFFEEAGEPAKTPTLPPAAGEAPDVKRLAALMVKYDQEVLGPPLG